MTCFKDVLKAARIREKTFDFETKPGTKRETLPPPTTYRSNMIASCSFVPEVLV